jgi:hypothetical protein
VNFHGERRSSTRHASTTDPEARMRDLRPARVHRALDRGWLVGLDMVGPPHSRRTPAYIRLGLEYRTSGDRRRALRAATGPVVEKLGLRVPRLRRSRYPFV